MKASINFIFIFCVTGFLGCKKEKQPVPAAEQPADFTVAMQVMALTCYPNDSTSMTFSVQPNGPNGPYSYIWKTPSNLSGPGPFTMLIKSNTTFEVDVTDVKSVVKKLRYDLKKDTIDNLKHDYRKQFLGFYACHVSSIISKQDSIGNWITIKNNYLDTVEVRTGSKFTSLYMTRLNPVNLDVNLNGLSFSNLRNLGKFLPNDSIYIYNFHNPIASSSNTFLGKKISK